MFKNRQQQISLLVKQQLNVNECVFGRQMSHRAPHSAYCHSLAKNRTANWNEANTVFYITPSLNFTSHPETIGLLTRHWKYSNFSEMAEGQEASNKITITVKTPKSKEIITIDENAEIKDVSIYLLLSISKFPWLWYAKWCVRSASPSLHFRTTWHF